MPLLERGLSAEFLGLELDTTRLGDSASWHEQISGRRHPAFPRSRGAWVAEVQPYCACPHRPVHLFLVVRLDAEDKVRRVETAVCEEVWPGEHEELSMPFFLPDMETARAVLTDGLTAASRAALRWTRDVDESVPLELSKLVRLIGRPVRSREVAQLVKRFRLSRLTALGGEGQEYTAPGKPLELRADFDHRVTTVFFGPRAVDVVDGASGERLTRESVRRRFGSPRPLAAGRCDRFESAGHVTVVDYDSAGAATRVTITASEVAS